MSESVSLKYLSLLLCCSFVQVLVRMFCVNDSVSDIFVYNTLNARLLIEFLSFPPATNREKNKKKLLNLAVKTAQVQHQGDHCVKLYLSGLCWIV